MQQYTTKSFDLSAKRLKAFIVAKFNTADKEKGRQEKEKREVSLLFCSLLIQSFLLFSLDLSFLNMRSSFPASDASSCTSAKVLIDTSTAIQNHHVMQCTPQQYKITEEKSSIFLMATDTHSYVP